jgi:hypothetical protein
MMDLERMTSEMLFSRFPISESMLAPPSTLEDDEFFKDLPVAQKGEQGQTRQPEVQKESTRAFSSYSYSSSSIVDDTGHRVSSIRRRYEDSTGRLKAIHEREVNGKRMKTVWNRRDKEDKGEHHTVCSGGTAEEFEKVWHETPFGKAQSQEQLQAKDEHERSTTMEPGSTCTDTAENLSPGEQRALKQKASSSYSATGAKQEPPVGEGYASGSAGAQLNQTATSQSSDPNMNRSREETIEMGSQRMEAETTPPEYNK